MPVSFLIALGGFVAGYGVCYWQTFRWASRLERMRLRRSRSRYADPYGPLGKPPHG
jgi:hypothetical protein